MRPGSIRAEGLLVTSIANNDLIAISQIQTTGQIGQPLPRQITYQNLIESGNTGLTAGSVPFISSTGTLTQDNANLSYNGTSHTLTATNITNTALNSTTITNTTLNGATINGVTANLGSSGVGGQLNIFSTTASTGNLRIIDNASTGNFITTIQRASQAAAHTYTVIDAGANANFVMTQSAQTLAGVMTFSSQAVLSSGLTSAGQIIAQAGHGLTVIGGANGKQNTATLVAGTVTVSNSSVTANSFIYISRHSANASTALGELNVGTITPGTSFVINSLQQATPGSVQTADVSTVFWMIVENA